MILKRLRAAWRTNEAMKDVMDTLGTMAADASYVVARAWEPCAGRSETEALGPEIRECDKRVNRAERLIRRRIIEHLNLNPGQDVSGCLAVLLIAKDVERIGDHGRNIFQVAQQMPDRIPGFRFFGELDDFYGEMTSLLNRFQQAVSESSPEKARSILNAYVVLKEKLKTFIPGLYSAGLPCDEAVATTLLARYMRRIIAHTGNAASGLVFPVESIDFISHGLRDEAKER